jgi:hypothetical protein
MSVGREESTLVPGAIFFSCETWNTGCTTDEEGTWNGTHLGNNFIRPEELEGQLLVRTRGKGGLDVWLKLEKNLVPHRKLSFRKTLVSLFLHTHLGPCEVLFNQRGRHLTVLNPGGQFKADWSITCINSKVFGSVTIQGFKRRVPHCGMVTIVVPILS